MKKRIVTRTWIRKNGQVTTRTYQYGGDKGKRLSISFTDDSGKKHKTAILVDKQGNVNHKAVNSLKEAIRNSNYDDKRSMIADLDNIVYYRQKGKQKLTVNGFFGTQAEDKTDRFFANAGYSTAEAAEALGITEAELRNQDNWHNGQFHINGLVYAFNFNYSGSLWQRV